MKKRKIGRPKGTATTPREGVLTRHLTSVNKYPTIHIHGVLMRMGWKPGDVVDVFWDKKEIRMRKHKNGR